MTWLRTLWQSTIGKKVVMAVTGFMMFCFVTGHLVGNLQIFIPDGGAKLDAYAHFLQSNKALLWTVRCVMLLAVGLHIVTALQLFLRNQAARPIPYTWKRWREANYASRTMIIGGPVLFFFVIYHILHFTTGQALPPFVEGKVHDNVIAGFSVWWAAAAYLVAMISLGLHLTHGAWSMFQSVGVNHPTYNPLLRAFGWAFGIGIALGNSLIVLSVVAGLVK